MSGKVIHQIWTHREGGCSPIPARFFAWHEKLITLNPTWKVLLWGNQSLKDVAGIDLHELYGKFWSPASVSNMVRLLLVEEYGGIYLDMDMEPHKPIDPLRQVYGNAVAADQGDGRICNAFFSAPPGHPWLQWQIRHGAGDCDPHNAAWGVYTMTKAPRDDLYLVPTELVYPYHYSVSPPEMRKPTENTICEHKWDGSWAK